MIGLDKGKYINNLANDDTIFANIEQKSLFHLDNPVFQDFVWGKIRTKAAIKGIPIHGHFELTPQCNLDCKMCYVHLKKEQMHGQKELSLVEWTKIIDEAINCGMIFASLSGGECLAYPYFDDLYLYLQSKGIIITILTNGVLLDKKVDFFCEHPPAYIQVSVYGANEEQYELVTGFRYFEKVQKNIILCIEKKLPIGISVTTSKYLKDISQIVHYYYQKKIPLSVSNWLMPPYDSTERSLEDFNLTPEEQIKISKDLIVNTGGFVPVPYNGTLPDSGGKNKSRVVNKGITCAAGRSDFSISWTGKMSMCVSLSNPTGDPLEEGFRLAWQKTNESAQQFCMPIECNDCFYENICHYCPAQHFVKNISGHCNPLVCQETILMVKEGLVKIHI